MATKFTVAPKVDIRASAELPTDVEHGGWDNGCVQWETAEGRFHAWLATDRKTTFRSNVPRFVKPYAAAEKHFGASKSPVIYKNPLVGRGEPGHFDTRYLDGTKKANAALLAEVFAAVDIDAAIAEFVRLAKLKHAADEIEAKEYQRAEKAKELLARLHNYVSADDASLPLAEFARMVADRVAEDRAA